MGDIYVHLRMKACCRKVLTEIDKEKKKAKSRSGILGAGSLAKLLGEKAIDAAKAAIPAGGEMPPEGIAGVEMERVTRQVCAKLCEKHAAEHEGKGETEEGAFWRELSGAFHTHGEAS